MKNKIIAIILASVLAATPAVQILAEDLVIEPVEEVIAEEADYEELSGEADGEANRAAEAQPEIAEDIEETEVLKAETPEDVKESELIQSDMTSDMSETLNLDEEVMVMSVEEVNDYASEEETELLIDTVEGEVLPSGLSTNAAPARLRMLGETTFDGSYGNQLDGTAKAVYDAMKKQYVDDGLTGELTIELSTPVTFQTLGTPNGSGGLTWSSSENAEYQQKVSCAMQAAYDAFVYDYPQVFWMNTFYYSTAISFTGGQGSYTGKVSRIRLTPVETYTNASGETEAFDASVAAAITELTLQADASKWETVKGIHDYLCTKLQYGDTGSAYAHSAAGAFLKDGSVVCEGYAKAFKILCSQFDIECILVVGNTDQGGHMWNYVRMEDGNWYLVDLTWDDQEDGTRDTYLLAGSGCQGFDAVISEERIVYTNFSGATYTNYFVVPILSESAYVYETAEHTHTWQVTEEKEPTCQESGYCISVCSSCHEESKVLLEKTVHRYENGLYIENNDATCTSDGTRTLLCDFGCGTTGGKIVVKGTAMGHSFGNYVSNQDARFSANGTKTATCEHGCGATKTVTDSNSKVKLNVSSLKLQKGQSTSAVKVTGLPSGVYVKSWKSSNKKIVKVSSSGKITAQKKTGTAKVTVTITNGQWTDAKSIAVTVQAGVVKTQKISVASKTLTIKKGKKQTITPVVTPITSRQKVTYTSSNKKVVTVSAKGVVTAKGAGTAKITVKSGSKKCTVTVKVPKTTTTKIKNLPEKLTLRIGKTKQLKPKLYPVGSDEKITYKSSKKSVASISAKGKITAKKKGTAIITVTSGKISVEFKLTVKQ